MNDNKLYFGEIIKTAKEKRKTIAVIMTGCLAISGILSVTLPKTWESKTLVQTRAADIAKGGAATAAAALGIGGASSPTMTYVALMTSEAVINPIIDELDWNESEKEFLTADKFAEKNLKIANKTQTNLITVTAKGKTPEEAQMISQHVVDNFLLLMTNMNQETQSLLVQFLNKRIDDTKKEADDAADKFAEYQKEHNLYNPGKQTELAMNQLSTYDDEIANMEVQAKTEQVRIDAFKDNLSEMKAGSLNFGINDNATVQAIRNQIVAKQVELTGLRQLYTEEHPSVINARQQLSQLQDNLSNEVNAVVSSQATTLNPAQAELVKQQALSQANLGVANESEKKLKEQRDKKAQEIGELPDAIVDYMNLQRDANIKNEVYMNLVKKCEADKIQQAMESMDIQIVDRADLPKKAVWPKLSLLLLAGFIVGMILSISYCVIVARRYEH